MLTILVIIIVTGIVIILLTYITSNNTINHNHNSMYCSRRSGPGAWWRPSARPTLRPVSLLSLSIPQYKTKHNLG